MDENQKEYFRRPGAADYMDVSERTVSDWQKRRLIPFVKMGRKCVLFRRLDLDRAIAKFTVQSVGDRGER